MNAARVSSLVIRTPEGVQFSYLIASPVARCFAWAIDFACIGAAFSLIRIMAVPVVLVSGDVAVAIQVFAMFALPISYGFLCEWYFRGQTLGKRLIRIRVIDAEGLQLQWNQVILRNLLRAVDMLPGLYLVGGATSWFSPLSQRLGDIAANTVVIHMPKSAAPQWNELAAGKFNSLRQYPHLEARLRQRVSPVEISVALKAILRRDEFETASRPKLYSQLATHFRSLVEFPPEAIESLSDEQFLRNVLDCLLRPRTSLQTVERENTP